LEQEGSGLLFSPLIFIVIFGFLIRSLKTLQENGQYNGYGEATVLNVSNLHMQIIDTY